MDSHVGLDYIVDNPDYCIKLASGKSTVLLLSANPCAILSASLAYESITNAQQFTLDCSTGHGMPIREEASRGVALCAVRLQSGWQAESHRYSSHLPGTSV